jgi:SGNH domain (fused to AT3 domains)
MAKGGMGIKGLRNAASVGFAALALLVSFTPATDAAEAAPATSDSAPVAIAAANTRSHPASHAGAVAPSLDDPSAVDWSQVESGNCLVVRAGWGFRACAKGDPKGYWRVGLIGDSHMRQYFAPLDILAKRYHWQVTYISKSACTVADWQLFPHNRAEPSCWDWNHKLADYFTNNPQFDLVINSNSAFVSNGDPAMAAAFKATVESQVSRGTKWLVISDNPKPALDFQACIAKNGSKAQQACALPYAKAMVPTDVLPAAVSSLPQVQVADFKKTFCPNLCPAVINGVQVYRDFSHISSNFARTMLPQLDSVIPEEFKHKPVSNETFAPIMSVSKLVSGL